MAIYHLSIKIISRGKGKSAVAASAYRSGEKIKNEYDGIVHDFTRKGGIAHTEILLPQNAPQEFSDRGTLWNSVEKIEKSKNPQLAREIEVALPKELDRKKQINILCLMNLTLHRVNTLSSANSSEQQVIFKSLPVSFQIGYYPSFWILTITSIFPFILGQSTNRKPLRW